LEPALIKEEPSLPKADRERTHPEAITALYIEFPKIHDNAQNLLPRHSGEGRNPVKSASPALRDKTQLHLE
jgi:hypothetical protein